MKKWGIAVLVITICIAIAVSGCGIYIYLQKSDLDKQNARLKLVNLELIEKNDILKKIKENAEDLVTTLEDQVTRLEGDVSRLENESKALQEEVDNLNSEVVSLEQTVDELENKGQDVIYVQPPDPTFEPTFSYHTLFPDMYVDTVLEYTDTNQKTVYLTFDDGPSERTDEILKILAEHDIKATFFVVPNNSEECKARLTAIAEAGHTIGIHTSSHVYNTIYSSVDNFLKDFNEAWQMVYDMTGIKCDIFRFPGGSINSYNRPIYQQLIAEMTRRGFVYFDWNTSGDDSAGQKTAEGIFNKTIQTAGGQKKIVLLLHDNSTKLATVKAVPLIIKHFKNKGYSFAVLSQNVAPVSYAYRFN